MASCPKSPLTPLFHGSIFLTMTLSLSNGSKGDKGGFLAETKLYDDLWLIWTTTK